MKTIEIQLLTKEYDEIGRLPLSTVAIEEGASGASLGNPSEVISQIEDFYGRIDTSLKNEKFTIVGNVVDFRLSVSRALLSDTTEPTIVVPLIVEPVNSGEPSDSGASNSSTTTPGTLDELFELPGDNGQKAEVHR